MARCERRREEGCKQVSCGISGKLGSCATSILWYYLGSENIKCRYRQPELCVALVYVLYYSVIRITTDRLEPGAKCVVSVVHYGDTKNKHNNSECMERNNSQYYTEIS
jgi:hypothetical protein